MGAASAKGPRPAPGVQFGRLTVLDRAPGGGAGVHRSWRCVCECGAETTVRGDNLRAGKTTSCGCYGQELNDERRLYFGRDGEAYLRHLWKTRGTLYGPLDAHHEALRTRFSKVKGPWQRELEADARPPENDIDKILDGEQRRRKRASQVLDEADGFPVDPFEDLPFGMQGELAEDEGARSPLDATGECEDDVPAWLSETFRGAFHLEDPGGDGADD